MAEMNIQIDNAEYAEIWKKDVDVQIEETQVLLKRVGDAIKSVKEAADGTIVDEIYKYGSDFLKFASEVQKNMIEANKVVGKVLKSFNDLIGRGINAIAGARKGI